MDQNEFAAWEARIAARAERLWQDAGEPEGGSARFEEQARMLISIEENPNAGLLDPQEAAEPVIEEASIMRNLGEFPTLTDQGEESTFPDDPDEDAANEDADLGVGLAIGRHAGSEDSESLNLAAGRDNAIRLDQGEDDDIRLSDGDASELGGVLPDEDAPDEDMADISVADADITSDDTDADNSDYEDDPDDEEDEDINDDGLVDQPVFDR